MTESAPRIVLASASPRRRQLLELLRLPITVRPAAVDETYRPGESPEAHAERLAREKALAVAASSPEALVVGSDTVVVLGDDVLGKPRDVDHAVEMLRRLQGREHRVVTAVAVAHGSRVESGVEVVRVVFRAFDEATARAYVKTGEPMDKAGAYGIQGLGATLVASIDGDFFAVMGLPLVRLMELFAAHGWHYDFRGLVPR